MQDLLYDIVIIGAGVSGCSSARELSRYNANILVLDKCEDVCCGTSKANSAIVHAGFDAQNGSLMAKLNLEGNLAMPNLCRDLDIPFIQNGSLVCCTNKDDMPGLTDLYERGIVNGVKEISLISREEILNLEPNISDNVCAALYASTGGIIDPFVLNLALAENAYDNGVKFKFDTKVNDLNYSDDKWLIKTNNGVVNSKCVVNAAGVYADVLHNMVSINKMHITARRGDYLLLDKTAGSHVSRTIFMLPSKFGKGVLVTPTVHGNLLVGPTAIDIDDKEATSTTKDGIDSVIEKSNMTVKNIPFREVITSFAGIRAHEDNHEFIIGECKDAPMFFDCSGIESPGLTSVPAIGNLVSKLVSEKLNLTKKDNFIDKRKGILNPQTLDEEDRIKLIKEKPEYGQIICRCESITEGEIIDAINRPIGAKSLDGVKRRVRAGMGRCQAGFCSPRVMEILSRELKIDITEVTKSGENSKILFGKNKQWL